MTSIGGTMNTRALEAAVEWISGRELTLAPSDTTPAGGFKDYYVLEAELDSGELVSITVAEDGSALPLTIQFLVHELASSGEKGATVRVSRNGEIGVSVNNGSFYVPAETVPGVIEKLDRIRELVLLGGGSPVVVPAIGTESAPHAPGMPKP